MTESMPARLDRKALAAEAGTRSFDPDSRRPRSEKRPSKPAAAAVPLHRVPCPMPYEHGASGAGARDVLGTCRATGFDRSGP
jgi:hypothetical protein